MHRCNFAPFRTQLYGHARAILYKSVPYFACTFIFCRAGPVLAAHIEIQLRETGYIYTRLGGMSSLQLLSYVYADGVSYYIIIVHSTRMYA